MGSTRCPVYPTTVHTTALKMWWVGEAMAVEAWEEESDGFGRQGGNLGPPGNQHAHCWLWNLMAWKGEGRGGSRGVGRNS